jgi:predicted metal-binding membrane protein
MTPHPPAPGHSTDLIEQLARRDRLFVVAGLLLVTLMAWWYVLAGAGMNMGNLDMSTPMPSSAGYATLVFFMWWIMMVAMILPSAAPVILLFALVNWRSRAAGAPYVSTAASCLLARVCGC